MTANKQSEESVPSVVPRITQQQLESYLWGAATLLRGTIDAGDYKQFIFPLLFYKRLCDVYDEETQTALDESGGDRDYAAFPEHHRFIIPPEAHWREIRRVAQDVGMALQAALRAIETANQDKLYGIFGDAQWTNKDRLSDRMLRDLIEHFSSLQLSVANLPEDELGQGYEYLIKKFADDSGHTAAEFYTNRTVVHLMTELLQPQPGESIYDPTCGSGGMLLSCIAQLKRQGKEWRNVRLYGQERNLMTSSIARMNCFLHGIEDFRIERGDTLSDPRFVEGDRLMQFDVVLANPPYSIKQWDRKAFASDRWGRNLYGTPPQGRADYAFWQHILRSLKPGTGRCAILFPHGVLFRQEEAEMRRRIIEADMIEAIIGLGPSLFYNSPMEACVVICRARKAQERRGEILFINAVEQVTREHAQSFLTTEHISRVVQAYLRFGDEAGLARIASIQDALARDANLSIPLYVGPASNGEQTGGGSLRQTLHEWLKSRQTVVESLRPILPDFALTAPNLELCAASASQLFDRFEWRTVSFGDVVRQTKEEVDPWSGEVKRYVAGEHMSSQDVHIRRWGEVGDGYLGPAFIRRFRKGQVLYGSRRTYLKKVALADFDGVTANTTFVLEPVDGRLLQVLLPWIMLSDAFTEHSIRRSKGSTNPYINFSDIAEFQFALPPLDQQRRIADILWAVDQGSEEWRTVEHSLAVLRSSYAAEAYGVGDSQSTCGECQGTLSDLVDINPALGTLLTDETQVSFLSMAGVSEDGRITTTQSRTYGDVRRGYTSFQDGDILFAKITPCMENGKGALVANMVSGVGFGSTEFHILRPKRCEDVEFVYHLTMTRQFRAEAKRYMRGSAGQQRVPAEFLAHYALRIPHSDRRREIGATLTGMVGHIQAVGHVRRTLAAMRTELLERLLGGS